MIVMISCDDWLGTWLTDMIYMYDMGYDTSASSDLLVLCMYKNCMYDMGGMIHDSNGILWWLTGNMTDCAGGKWNLD